MSDTNKKLHINDTVLFKQVASVLGKGKALEELTRAYRGSAFKSRWDWDSGLRHAFGWGATPQGDKYWLEVYNAIHK